MLGAIVPWILYQWWFWLLILLGLFPLLRFVKRRGRHPQPFPRIGAFFTRHKEHVETAFDAFVIGFVVLSGGLGFFLSGVLMVDALRADPTARALLVRSAWSFGLIVMIFWSCQTAFLFGLLTRFHRNLTRCKRVFLLALCLLPGALMVVAVAVDLADMHWSLLQIGLIGSLPGWILNAPPILARRDFLDFVWPILRKLRLVPSDSSP
jgi:hypothetical protein